MPALIFLVVVTQIPFLVTIGMSFLNWNILYPKDTGFGGLSNYAQVLSDPRMRAAMWNTVVMVTSSVFLSLFIGTGLALLLNRKFFGRGIVRTLLITPFLIMPMASSLMWKHLIYNPDYGMFNGHPGVARSDLRLRCTTAGVGECCADDCHRGHPDLDLDPVHDADHPGRPAVAGLRRHGGRHG